MTNTMLLSACLLAVLITCRAAPAPPPPFADEKANIDSADFNEVGPEENWQLFNRMTKTKTFDPSDSEKTRRLMKEIEEFSRLATQASVTDEPDSTATDQPDVTETDSASSDWFASTWRNMNRNDDGDTLSFRPQSERQEEPGNVEDMIKRISNDLKKLYAKIKQAITTMKNWVNNARGSKNEFDESFPMTASASESDGVFVIADPLIADPLIGDIDKSNKYTLPISAD